MMFSITAVQYKHAVDELFNQKTIFSLSSQLKRLLVSFLDGPRAIFICFDLSYHFSSS